MKVHAAEVEPESAPAEEDELDIETRRPEADRPHHLAGGPRPRPETDPLKEPPKQQDHRIRLPKDGPRAEVFVVGMGIVLALLVDSLSLETGLMRPYHTLRHAGILTLAGLTILLGVRGGAILADVAFAAALWLCGEAWLMLYGTEWLSMARYAVPFIAVIGILRIVRYAVALPAAALTYVYATGDVQPGETLLHLLGLAFVVVTAAILLYRYRDRIRAGAKQVWSGRLV